MSSICFATTNPQKIQIAQAVCAETNFTVEPVALDIDEIQGEDPELIVRDKARRAYEKLGKPVVVSDDTWDIRALKGFPGAYMKSINHWFEPEDFLRLMHGIEDRHITLHQYLAYTDGSKVEVFQNDVQGQVINEARGKSDASPNMTVIALELDNGKTIAEALEQDTAAVVARYKDQPDVWHAFIDWFSVSQE